jgi:uncharacterized membrane protein
MVPRWLFQPWHRHSFPDTNCKDTATTVLVARYSRLANFLFGDALVCSAAQHFTASRDTGPALIFRQAV